MWVAIFGGLAFMAMYGCLTFAKNVISNSPTNRDEVMALFWFSVRAALALPFALLCCGFILYLIGVVLRWVN